MRVIGPEQTPSPGPEVDTGTHRVAEELSLWDFIDPLVSSWVSVGVIALLGAGLAFTLASLRRPIYEATAVIRIVGDQAEAVRANIRLVFENRTMAGELIREFGVTSKSRWTFLSGSSPAAADTFHRDHVTVEQLAGTNLLRVSVRLESAEQAAKVANALVARVNALNRRMSQQEDIDARDDIKARLDEAARRLETIRIDLLTVKQKSQVDTIRADTNSALEARTKLLELQGAIEYERAFLASSEADLKASQPLLTTRRTIDRNPALVETAKAQGAGESVPGLEYSEQQLNEAYSTLQGQIAGSRARLAGLERQRRMLIDDKNVLSTLSRLYESELAIARTQGEYDEALRVYTDLSTKHEDARIRVGSRGTALQLVDPAVTPRAQVPPRAIVIAQLGGVLGLLVGCLLVLGRHFFYRHRVG